MYNRALKLVRQYHRLSQVAVAEKLGLSKSFISELEREGGKKPSLDVLERYAKAFGITLSSLMIFAEQTANPDLSEKSRVFVADKILKILEWIEETSDSSGSDAA